MRRSYSACHALVLNNLNWEKSDCCAVTTPRDFNLHTKRYLMVAIFLDCLNGFIWITPNPFSTGAFQRVAQIIIIHRIFLATNGYWYFSKETMAAGSERLSATPYVYFLYSHPLLPDENGESQDNRAGVTKQGARNPPAMESPLCLSSCVHQQV